MLSNVNRATADPKITSLEQDAQICFAKQTKPEKTTETNMEVTNHFTARF